jgi:hypothetical protein
MADAKEFGKFYWGVKVPKVIASTGHLFLYADRVEVTSGGEVLFWRSPGIGEQQDHLSFSLARGCWLAVFAASMMDNQAVAIQEWESGNMPDKATPLPEGYVAPE